MNFNNINFRDLKKIPVVADYQEQDPIKFARQFHDRVYSYGRIDGSTIIIYTYIYISKNGEILFSNIENIDRRNGGTKDLSNEELLRNLFNLSMTYQTYTMRYLGNYYEN